MERNIQLNWPSVVEEAIKRRKSQNLTQKQLAVLAGVSGPTVNRFEQRHGNITLKSAFAILKTLGLMA
jgi:transcriptional regulator with XRE-family HTH domain